MCIFFTMFFLLFLLRSRCSPSERGHLAMSLTLVLTDLEHEVNGFFVACGECERVLVADERAVVGELAHGLLHGGGELLVEVEAGLDELRGLLQRDLAAAARDHLVEELQSVARGEVALRESAVRVGVQVVLRQVAASEKVLVQVNLRLVIDQVAGD